MTIRAEKARLREMEEKKAREHEERLRNAGAAQRRAMEVAELLGGGDEDEEDLESKNILASSASAPALRMDPVSCCTCQTALFAPVLFN